MTGGLLHYKPWMDIKKNLKLLSAKFPPFPSSLNVNITEWYWKCKLLLYIITTRNDAFELQWVEFISLSIHINFYSHDEMLNAIPHLSIPSISSGKCAICMQRTQIPFTAPVIPTFLPPPPSTSPTTIVTLLGAPNLTRWPLRKCGSNFKSTISNSSYTE